MKPKIKKLLKGKTLLFFVIMIVITLIWLVPLVYMINMSFRTQNNIFAPTLFVKETTLKNYATVFKQNPELPLNFLSSLIVTISSVILITLFSSMIIFGLSRKGVKGKVLIYNTLLATLMVPISALVIPLTQINSRMGWMNNYLGLILPYTALGIPFSMVILKGFMDGFPIELEESAIIDGCGIGKLYLKIVMPILRPGILVVIIWQFLTSWNEFFLALCTMTETTFKTLPLIAQQYQGTYFSQPGALFATLTMITIPIILFYICVQKQFVNGLISGAVKG